MRLKSSNSSFSGNNQLPLGGRIRVEETFYGFYDFYKNLKRKDERNKMG
jgi:hypothetical protein